jgi:ankyrin repeat protein
MCRTWIILLLAGTMLFSQTSRDLLAAIREGNHAQVRSLLRGGADVNAVDADGTTPLMHSVIESDVDMMKLLIDSGAKVNSANSLGSTALMYAVVNVDKAKLLLDRGAEVKTKGTGGATPMSVAVTTFGSTPVLKLLIAKGAEPEDRLMVGAAQKGDLEAIRYLLSIGVSPGGADSATLFAAITARCEECVRLLVEKGAPVKGSRLAGGLAE